MHNLKRFDKAFQLRNAFRNISGHSTNAFAYLTGFNSQIRFIIWWKAIRLYP